MSGRGERGAVLIVAVAFMALIVPLVTAALGLAGTLSVDSRVKTQIAKHQYSALGGDQHALHRLLNDPSYGAGLIPDVPDNYTVDLNGAPVQIAVTKLSAPLGAPPPPSAPGFLQLQTTVLVTPATASESTPTTFDYTITVENQGTTPRSLDRVNDGLPAGFNYVPGSSSGATTADPSVTLEAGPGGGPDFELLTWDVTSLGIVLLPTETVSLSFQAQASVPEGNYCTDAWVEPGNRLTGSGLTAKITVGSPPDGLCPGEAATITVDVVPEVATADTATTFTYTLEVENTGTSQFDLVWVMQKLPLGFQYVNGSTTGSIASWNPWIFTSGGQEHLNWFFLIWGPSANPGETLDLQFQAQATLGRGVYWTDAWVVLDLFWASSYTWPTAPVRVMDVFSITASGGGSTVSSEVWVGDDTHYVSLWEIAG